MLERQEAGTHIAIHVSYLTFLQEQHMTSACRKYCLEAIELSEKLIKLSQDAHADCDDDHSLVLLGIILDSASKIHLEAEKRLKSLEAKTAKHV
jgi:hypothetical protein